MCGNVRDGDVLYVWEYAPSEPEVRSPPPPSAAIWSKGAGVWGPRFQRGRGRGQGRIADFWYYAPGTFTVFEGNGSNTGGFPIVTTNSSNFGTKQHTLSEANISNREKPRRPSRSASPKREPSQIIGQVIHKIGSTVLDMAVAVTNNRIRIVQAVTRSNITENIEIRRPRNPTGKHPGRKHPSRNTSVMVHRRSHDEMTVAAIGSLVGTASTKQSPGLGVGPA